MTPGNVARKAVGDISVRKMGIWIHKVKTGTEKSKMLAYDTPSTLNADLKEKRAG